MPLDKYEYLKENGKGQAEDYAVIADVFQELGVFIRFIACDLELEKKPAEQAVSPLTLGQILKLVNLYIGVSGGYLGDFSYQTHRDFYPQFCDLDIDPGVVQGTTRERFIHILQTSGCEAQSRIIKGILNKYPAGSSGNRTPEMFEYFSNLAAILTTKLPIPSPSIVTASDVLRRSLADAEALIAKNGAVSAVDRIHTALHSYLVFVCARSGITHEEDANLTRLFRLLREQHPALQNQKAGSQEIGRVIQACATIMDALNPLRNRLSLAHPNESLLDDDEAMLVVNVARTLLHYLGRKLDAPVVASDTSAQ